MPVTDAVRRAWQENVRVNRVLTDHLTPAMLDARTPGGSFTVAQQLAHMTGVTRFWGTLFDEAFHELPYLGDPDDGPDAVEADLARIREAVEATQAAALRHAEAADGVGRLSHPDLDAYLVHMTVHDAHHRGQILLALKEAGHALPDEDAMWGPWRGE